MELNNLYFYHSFFNLSNISTVKKLLSCCFLFLASEGFGQNIGIGTNTPISRLNVKTNGYGFIHSDATDNVQVGTYVSSSGGWIGTKSNHSLNFFTNNSTELMTLTPAGRLGIGVTNPLYPLTLKTDPLSSGIIHTDGSIVLGTYIGINVAYLQTYSNHPLSFATNNAPAQMTLSTAGNLGIGVFNPADKLSVRTSTNTTGLSHSDGTASVSTYVGTPAGGGGLGGWLGTKSNHPLYLFTNNSAPDITLLQSGKFGIGTVAPNALLEVAGATNNLIQSTNTNALGVGVKNSIFFKNGNRYTGIIETYGSSATAANIGFKTFSSTDAGALVERLTILDNGNVGINKSLPTSRLEVLGKTTLNQSFDNAALQVNGDFIYKDGNEASGAILASDGSGKASWQPLIFFRYELGSITRPNATAWFTPTTVPIASALSGTTGSYLSGNRFIAPVSGYYQFNVTATITACATFTTKVALMSDVNIILAEANATDPNGSLIYPTSVNFSTAVYLAAGGAVRVTMQSNCSNVSIPIFASQNAATGGYNHFSGYLIR